MTPASFDLLRRFLRSRAGLAIARGLEVMTDHQMAHAGLLQLSSKGLGRQLSQGGRKPQHAQGVQSAVLQHAPAIAKTGEPRRWRRRREVFARQRFEGDEQAAQAALGRARQRVPQQGIVAPVQTVIAAYRGHVTGVRAQRRGRRR